MALSGGMSKHMFRGNTLVHVDKRFAGGPVAQVVYDPAAGKKLVITDIIITSDTAGQVTLFSDNDAEGDRIVDMYIPANGGIDRVYPPERPLPLPADAILKITGPGNVTVLVNGWVE